MERKPVNWKTNLVAVWISQFITQSAFSFCLPFLPLYLREKKAVPEDEIAFWAGIFIAAASFSLMIMSPIWGALGDKYGRKMMLVRATLSGGICLYLLGIVDNLWTMLALRLLQGVFTGTVPAAQSLVAASTPDDRQGFALGLLMAAISAAATAGAYFGGLYASAYGASAAFEFSGYSLVFATLVVLVLVREDFHPPARLSNSKSARIRRRKDGIHHVAAAVPALVTICFLALLQTFDGPYLALYVEELYMAGAHAAGDISSLVYRTTGNINALASIVAIVGSLAISYLMDRKTPRVLWAGFGLATVVGMVILQRYGSIAGLSVGRCMFLFFVNGLASGLVVLMSRLSTPEKRGAAMGWTVTARSLGWVIAPVMGAWVANHSGYLNAYLWLGGASLLLPPMMLWITWRYAAAFGRTEPVPEVPQPYEELLPPEEKEQADPAQTKSSVRLFVEHKVDEIK